MNPFKFLFSLLILFLIYNQNYAASNKVDSLKNVIRTTSTDSSRIIALNDLGLMLMYNDPDTSIALSTRALKLAKGIGNKNEIAISHNNLGAYHYLKNDYAKSLEHHFKSLEIKKELNNKRGIAASFGNIGIVYKNQSKFQKALEAQLKSLKFNKEVNNKSGISASYINIGVIHESHSNYPKALEYYFKSLEINKEIEDKRGIASSYNNIGLIYDLQGNLPKALEYYSKSLDIRKELEDKRGMSRAYNNMGIVYKNQNEYKKALEYYFKSLEIRKELNNERTIAEIYNNLGSLLSSASEESDSTREMIMKWFVEELEWGKDHLRPKSMKEAMLTLAEQYQRRSLKLNKKIGDKESMTHSLNNLGTIAQRRNQYHIAIDHYYRSLLIADTNEALREKQDAAIGLSQAYEELGKDQDALKYHKLYSQFKDSVFNEEKQKELGRQESQFIWKQKLIKKEKEQEKHEALAEERAHRQNVIIYSVSGGGVLVLIFLLLLYNRFRIIRQQRNLIEEQKTEVEQKKQEAEEQKEVVEEKNTEILDSINYARRLQEAILPPMNMMREKLPESFVLFKPKDVVSGDFYWMEVDSSIVYFAAADCTGHGVPGAMVSVVCANSLSKALMEEGITEPAKILDRTRELVVETFGRSEREIKDGMDISLCAFDPGTRELQWAGANNPLWIIPPGGEEVQEVKPDKQPVGKFASSTPFTGHKVRLEEGASIYMFSDGFPDQFGGERGKKYKAKRMKEFLLKIRKDPMERQKEMMDEEFENWKGKNEQVDDVCVVGMKVSGS